MNTFVCITGATGGLGKAFAVECASRGWNLFLTDISDEALESLAHGLTAAYGVNVIYHSCDLTDSSCRQELFELMRRRELKFWSLINVAGIDYEGPFADKTLMQIRTILRLNIEAVLEITSEVLKLHAKGQSFMVINVSSLAAYYPMPVKAMYSASKRFMLDFSLALREEIRDIGGTVTALCPAGMPTTELTIKGIDAQGFMGRITTKNVGYVASKTIDHALKGQSVYVPGLVNRFIGLLGRFLPPALVARIVGLRWKAAHLKSHACNSVI